jgi:hypothetical protein
MSYTLYAHRGNLFGPKPELENTPDYIDQAIKFGFKVEVDVWLNSDNNLPIRSLLFSKGIISVVFLTIPLNAIEITLIVIINKRIIPMIM